MDNKERLRKWLWLGLDETTAKKYQRKLSAENVRIIRNESVIIALESVHCIQSACWCYRMCM